MKEKTRVAIVGYYPLEETTKNLVWTRYMIRDYKGTWNLGDKEDEFKR